MDDSLQPTIDMLLNVSIFMWYGAVCPWHKFLDNDVIPIYRLIPLGILVLLLRRIPMVLAYHYLGLVHQIEDIRHAFFVGFFGPIGVSAVFYLYISKEFLAEIVVNGNERVDAQHLSECIDVIVWFLVVCSIFVHGLSVPLGKLFFYLPRTISTAISTERVSASQSMARSPSTEVQIQPNGSTGDNRDLLPFRRRLTTSERGPVISSPSSIAWIPKSFVRAGRHIFNDIRRPHGQNSHVARDESSKPPGRSDNTQDPDGIGGAHPEISLPLDPRPIGRTISRQSDQSLERAIDSSRVKEARDGTSGTASPIISGTSTPTGTTRIPRTIQFADESRISEGRLE